MDTLTRKAYAKINLGLDVLRRREDGYHEVKMIMQTVDIYDVLTFVKAPADVFRLSVDSAQIPDDDNNLVLKAARLLFATAGIDAGVEVTLQKNIPVAAGMAGGSTDAAATLIGLNALYDLRFTTEQLQEIGVKLGADIPYCIMGGTALSQGIGEILRPLPAPPRAHLVIAKPDLMISTKYVYENLHANSLKVHPNIDGMIETLSNQDLTKMCSLMGNVLETVTEKENPIITQIKDLMKEQGATGALMSGSGPTVFSIFTEEEKARSCFQKIQEENLAKQLFLTRFHNTGNPT